MTDGRASLMMKTTIGHLAEIISVIITQELTTDRLRQALRHVEIMLIIYNG